jgi:hypothetical protein
MPDTPDCENARKNPRCPYLATINQARTDIEIIKKALVGDIAVKEPGLIEELRDISAAVKRSTRAHWTAKDYGTLLVGLAALLTAIVASLR